MTEIGTIEKGKVGELIVLTEVLKRGASVFIPVVDTVGIDAIVRKRNGVLLELQIKTRGTEYTSGWFDVYVPKDYRLEQLVVVFVDIACKPEEVWIFPARVLMDYAIKAGGGEDYPYFRLNLNARSRRHNNQLRRHLLQQDYLNTWYILTD